MDLSSDHIVVRPKKKGTEDHYYKLTKFMRSNQSNCYNQKPIVFKGTRVTKGQVIADLEGLADRCIAFSDDGHGVQDAGMMREAMSRAAALNKMIVAHCEVNDLLNGGYIHDGIIHGRLK